MQRTTIEPGLQRRVEALLHREAAALDPQATLAALVVDNRAREVIAYVGNADFAAVPRHGTLDMARAVRSPGSALKPFIYAMAFDRLIIHPQTVLDDRPRHFGDYMPSDFDGRFQGEVSAAEALRYSLNAPLPWRPPGAQPVTSALPPRNQAACRRARRFARGGAGRRRNIALRPRHVAPSHGGDRPLGRRAGRRRFPRARGGSRAAAAWYVNDTWVAPPPGMLPAEVRRSRHLAFKTGTSYGFRDAWAVGYDSRVTIAVWAGRPDGTPMPGRSGRVTAAPVLFKIADLLGPAPAESASEPPTGVVRASHRDLPPALRRLDPAPLEAGHGRDSGREPGGPKILYPPNGAIVAWDGAALPLEAVGGRAPLAGWSTARLPGLRPPRASLAARRHRLPADRHDAGRSAWACGSAVRVYMLSRCGA